MRPEPKFSKEATERGHMVKIAIAQNALNLCQEATDKARGPEDRNLQSQTYLETLPALRAARCALMKAERDMRKDLGIVMPPLPRGVTGV